MWASYAVFDPSYANRQSFGFFIDVGNGLTTLAPTLIFLVSLAGEGSRHRGCYPAPPRPAATPPWHQLARSITFHTICNHATHDPRLA